LHGGEDIVKCQNVKQKKAVILNKMNEAMTEFTFYIYQIDFNTKYAI